jgi:hypothetical protein
MLPPASTPGFFLGWGKSIAIGSEGKYGLKISWFLYFLHRRFRLNDYDISVLQWLLSFFSFSPQRRGGYRGGLLRARVLN